MGTLYSMIRNRIDALLVKDARVLMLGLDASGKTTILYKLHLGQTMHTIPTIGFNVESVRYKHFEMTCWDVGGQEKLRPLWVHYYQNTDALIFVVDSNDRDRIDQAHTELAKLVESPQLLGSPLLVFANKQDLPNRMNAAEVVDKLKLRNLRDRRWYVQETSATTGDGLYEGLDWLIQNLSNK